MLSPYPGTTSEDEILLQDGGLWGLPDSPEFLLFIPLSLIPFPAKFMGLGWGSVLLSRISVCLWHLLSLVHFLGL